MKTQNIFLVFPRLNRSLRACLPVLAGMLLASFTASAGTPQTILFAEIPNQVNTNPPFPLVATASSGLPVSFTVVSAGNLAALSGTNVTLTGAAGSVTIAAHQAGNGAFDPAPVVTRTFVVRDIPGFRQLALGSQAGHMLALRSDGTLWAWGQANSGQLGTGFFIETNLLTQVGAATNWIFSSVGGNHTLAIRSDGSLWAWGNSGNGQLGLGNFSPSAAPQQVGTATNWLMVSAGNSYTLAVKTNGTLWAWGANSSGQLGIGSFTQTNGPAQVGADTNWVAAAAGNNQSAALKSDGTLWAWGANSSGQLGIGNSVSTNAPVQVGVATNWLSVSVGSQHTVALKTDGTLWTWGGGGSGQLGGGNLNNTNVPVQIGTVTNWQSAVAGGNHTVAIKNDGTLWAWGANGNGQLGLGNQVNTNVPWQVGLATNWTAASATVNSTLAVKNDGTIWGWGSGDGGLLVASSAPVSLAAALGSLPVAAAATGDGFSEIIKSDGTLWAWGGNLIGQLGDGTTTTRLLPAQIGTATNWQSIAGGANFTLGIRTDGSLWGWGLNNSGQLGVGNNVSFFTPAQTGIGSTWQSVSAGGSFTLAIKTDGTLWSCGNNANGQLGLGNTVSTNTLQPVGTATNWATVSASGTSVAALRTDGTIWCWGGNANGQLGIGNLSQSNSPVQISGTNWQAVVAGNAFVLALRKDGTLWAWGANGNGQLGNGCLTSAQVPVQVGSATNWQSIAAGSTHSAAIKTDGTLWVWGAGSSGQLGDGNIVDRTVPEQLGGSGWTFVVSGSQARHTLAWHNGFLWAFGSDLTGQVTGGDFGRVVPRLSLPSRGAQTVTIAPVTPQINVPVPLAATASSGLPVNFTIRGPATFTNNILTPTAGGVILIDASQAGDDNAWTYGVTNLTLLVTAPNLDVMKSDGSLVSAGETYDFNLVPIGPIASVTFIITNSGLANLSGLNLTVDGTNAGDFILYGPGSTTVPPGGSTTFSVGFNPQTNNVIRNAVLHLASNVVGSPNPFNLGLTGQGLSFGLDSDGDGLSDAQELLLAPLGFNWQVSQSALVNYYFASANGAGLFSAEEIQAMKPDARLLARSPANDPVTIILGWQQSTNLADFTPLRMDNTAFINAQGQLQFPIQPTNQAVFYRTFAQ